MISLGLVLVDGVHRRGVRVGVADLADRLDALGADELEREVDARLGGVEHGVVVDHQAGARPVLGHAEHEAHVALGDARPHGVDQRPAAERLVGDDEDACAHSLDVLLARRRRERPRPRPCLASAGGLKIPCTAPGTPYS